MATISTDLTMISPSLAITPTTTHSLASSSSSALSTAAVYNRLAHQEIYRATNQNDPTKIKNLRIVLISQKMRPEMIQKLKDWHDESFKKIIDIYSMKDGKDKTELLDKIELLDDCKTMANRAITLLRHNPTVIVKVAEDDKGNPQAVSITQCEKNACDIDCLVSSPFNIIGTIHKEGDFRGAGTALIEDAIFQSLAAQSIDINQPIPTELLMRAEVTLDSFNTRSDSFYKNARFTELLGKSGRGRGPMILTGNNVVDFLNKFGGRASSIDRH